MDVKKAAAETKDYIVSIRREFHRHPELSLQEFRTAQRIEEELDKFGIPHTRVGVDRRARHAEGRKGQRKSAGSACGYRRAAH